MVVCVCVAVGTVPGTGHIMVACLVASATVTVSGNRWIYAKLLQ